MCLHFCQRTKTGSALLLAVVLTTAVSANDRGKANGAPDRNVSLKSVEPDLPGGQILSYRHLAGSTDVVMRGTKLAPNAQAKLKIGSRPGFVELDINRGNITGLVPAHRLGQDFLTYVLWAVSVDGRASNLGEITFEGDRPVPVNVTTPYQTFWLMITAEPNYAVVDPSQQIVLYSVKQESASENRALDIPGKLFYFSHYNTYLTSAPSQLDPVPNQLLQARKAVQLAEKSGVQPSKSGGSAGFGEEASTRNALEQARIYLQRAEDAFRKSSTDQEVVQFARTSSQIAENARALAMGAVGGLATRQLEAEVKKLESEVTRLQAETKSAPTQTPTTLPTAPIALASPPVQVVALPLVKQPALWFAVAGWALAIVALFRRKSI
jgi:hypothetical protein